jgi:hypothetical protein
MFGAWLSTLTDAAAATAEHVYKQTALTGLTLPAKGLVTTVLGLGGVFLVLLLFFFAIKLMQNFGKKDAANE